MKKLVNITLLLSLAIVTGFAVPLSLPGSAASGSFCDLTKALGTSHAGDYAISIFGVDSVANLPEPGSVFLLLAGGALIALLRRRTFSSR
jgi:hypothetical protein